ncbi:MAG: alpha/beta fold hydrolase [Spirochaetaceae bacterium]|nr:MAG: alpha/beta fold hydrolase [Spirochaetaceae bacterium]
MVPTFLMKQTGTFRGLRRSLLVPATIAGALVLLHMLSPMTVVADSPADARRGGIIDITFEERVDPTGIANSTIPLFEHFEHPAPRYAVDVYSLRFWSSDFDGSPLEALATLYIPVVDQHREAPVLAFLSGTTGVGNQCATSLEEPEVIRWGWYRQNMLAYGGQGIITIFPDYLGFNNDDIPQRYFSAAAEGHLMLDALRAARNVFSERPLPIHSSVRPGPGNVTAGYSQGGHAALAAADMNLAYAPEIRLNGAIGFGSTNNVETLMREAAYYTPYILLSYRSIYGPEAIDYSRLIQPRWLPTLEEDVMRMCVDQFQTFFPFDGRDLYTPEFYAALHGNRLHRDFPLLKRILDENETGLSGHGKPVLMIQGNQDIIITNPEQRRYVERLRSSGSEVEYVEMEGVRHRHTRPAGFARSVDFIRRVTE